MNLNNQQKTHKNKLITISKLKMKMKKHQNLHNPYKIQPQIKPTYNLLKIVFNLEIIKQTIPALTTVS